MSLKRAIRHAKKNPIVSKGRTNIGRMGAVLSDGYNSYLSWNSYRTHPLQAKYAKKAHDPFKIHLHAEIGGIVQALSQGIRQQDLKYYTMYVARVLKDGSTASARPCPVCLGALEAFGITRIYYTE